MPTIFYICMKNNLLLITFSLHGNFPFDRLYNLRITTHAKKHADDQ